MGSSAKTITSRGACCDRVGCQCEDNASAQGSASMTKVLGVMLVALAGAMLLCGCATFPPKKDFMIKHSEVRDNLWGPLMPVAVKSLTSFEILYHENGSERTAVLDLRGVKPTPSDLTNRQAERWLEKMRLRSSISGRHLFLLQDTMVVRSDGTISGVVLQPWQDSISHNLATGESTMSVSVYRVVQSAGLYNGTLLLDRSDAEWAWYSNFAYWEDRARRERRGYWRNPVQSAVAETQED